MRMSCRFLRYSNNILIAVTTLCRSCDTSYDTFSTIATMQVDVIYATRILRRVSIGKVLE